MNRRRFVTTFASAAPLLVPAAARAADHGTPSEIFLEAVRTGRASEVRSFLRSDDSLVYARDREGRSAYVLAHLHRRPEIAAILADHGFLMDVVEATLARSWARVDEIGAASPGAFTIDHPFGGTVMHAAAFSGLGRDVWRLLQYGADPDANPRGSDGITPVRFAVDHPDRLLARETVANLLGNGGDARAPQSGGSSVLHGAAAVGDLDMIRLILRKGGDPALIDEAGRTAEAVARDLGHPEVAALLRDHEQVARDHRTSRFAFAADGSRYEAADLTIYDRRLVNATVGGAHFNLDATAERVSRVPELATAVSYSDEAAVEAAAHTGQQPIVRALLDRGAPYSLPTAGTMGDVEWASRLLDQDPDRVHERGAHDFAMMWYTAIGGQTVGLAELLLARGADVDQEHMGTTALHWAARAGHAELAAFLLEHGADPDRIGRKFVTAGETPLDHARSGEHQAVESVLRAAGATRLLATGP